MVERAQQAAPAEERRSGKDRRSGMDRRAGDRRGGFGGIGRKGAGFFDHPWLVAGTVVVGVVIGVLIMKLTARPAPAEKPVTRGNGALEVIVKPDGAR